MKTINFLVMMAGIIILLLFPLWSLGVTDYMGIVWHVVSTAIGLILIIWGIANDFARVRIEDLMKTAEPNE